MPITAVGTPYTIGQTQGGNPYAPFGATNAFGTNQYTFAGDPAVLMANASAQRALAFAQQQALASQRQLLIDYGDPQLAASVLGAGATTDIAAAGNNPFSILQQLARQAQKNITDIDASMNRRNLFYSSTRVKGLTDEGTRELQAKYNAARDVQAKLDNVQRQLQQAQLSATDAQQQSILQALANRTSQVASGG